MSLISEAAIPRPARVTPDQILSAAAVEFARRGFGGARVDRIARRAHVNKAMLYYHFQSKQGLYRALLRRSFALAAERIRLIAAGGGSPSDKVDRLIAGLADLIREHAFFPAIMLREVAEGGAHLDRETLKTVAAVPRAVGGIVHEGVEQGCFRDVHPLFAHFTIIAPLVFYLAAGPIREELGALHLAQLPRSPDAFIRHMQDVMRRALAREASSRATS